jgi:hypothetical protein
MSAYHLSERQLTRADCGAAGFVPKPLDLGELARFLRTKVAGVASAFDVSGDARGALRVPAVAGATAPR